MESNKRSIWQRYKAALASVDRKVGNSLGALGELIAHYPIRTIVISLVVALGLSAGLAQAPSLIETRGEKLWVPQNSDSMRLDDYVQKWIGNTDDRFTFVFEAKDATSVLTPEATTDMWEVMAYLFNVTIEHDGQPFGMNDACWKSATGACRSSGYLEFWRTDRDFYTQSLASSPLPDEEDVLNAVQSDTFPNGTPVSRELIMAGIEVDDAGMVTSAQQVAHTWPVDPDMDSDLHERLMKAFEDIFFQGKPQRDEFFARFEHINIYWLGPGDIMLVVIAVIIIFLFASIVLFKPDLVASRATLGLLGVLSVALSIGAGYGIAMICQIPFTSLTQILPFILLGIGVDDMFVLVRAMEEMDARAGRELPLPVRFRRCLQCGGMSMTHSSLTNCAAFAFGSITSIPAIRWFCGYAAISIVTDWILQLTFFIGCFVLTERRIAAGRLDWLCCLPPRKNPTEVQSAMTNVISPADEVEASKAQARKVTSANGRYIPKTGGSILSGDPDSLFQVFLTKVYLPFLFNPFVSVAVIVVCIGAAIAGGIGITKITEGLLLSDLSPDGHYVKEFAAARDSFDDSSGSEVGLYFRGIDHSDPDVQSRMLATWRGVMDYSYFDPDASPTSNWLTSLHDWLAANESTAPLAREDGTVAQEGFYTNLNAFLDEQPIWKDDIVDSEKKDVITNIEVSVFDVVTIIDTDSKGAFTRRLLRNAQKATSELNDEYWSEENDAGGHEYDTSVFVFTSDFVFSETDAVILEELLTNLSLAVTGVALISLIMLINPVAMLIVVLCIIMVDLLLFLELWVLGIRLNSVSVINLVMAVGLSVCYTTHIVHKFLGISKGTRKDRAKAALAEIGAAIFVGILSTGLGILPLSGANSTIFRTFFELLLGTVIFGAIIGLMFAPVLLSFIGPPPCIHHYEDDVVDQKQLQVVTDGQVASAAITPDDADDIEVGMAAVPAVQVMHVQGSAGGSNLP